MTSNDDFCTGQTEILWLNNSLNYSLGSYGGEFLITEFYFWVNESIINDKELHIW